jgi:hypothetical protein
MEPSVDFLSLKDFLSWDRLEVSFNDHTYSVPNDYDLIQIYSILPDLESQQTFYKWHSSTIEYLLITPFTDYLRGVQVHQKSPEIIYNFCCRIGYSYELWCRYWFIRSYFHRIFSHGVVSPRSLSHRAVKKQSSLEHLKATSSDNSLKRILKASSEEYPQELMCFSSYKMALAQQQAWAKALSDASKENRAIYWLRTKFIESSCLVALPLRKQARAARRLPKIPYWCPYCKRLIEIQHQCGNPIRANCGAPDCVRAYERVRKQKNRSRNTTHEIEPKWVRAKKGRCKGCTTSTSISEDGFCKNCHRENHAHRDS